MGHWRPSHCMLQHHSSGLHFHDATSSASARSLWGDHASYLMRHGENVKADAATCINVWMVDSGLKLDMRGFERVASRILNTDCEDSLCLHNALGTLQPVTSQKHCWCSEPWKEFTHQQMAERADSEAKRSLSWAVRWSRLFSDGQAVTSEDGCSVRNFSS